MKLTIIRTSTLAALRDQMDESAAYIAETERELEVTEQEATRLAAELDAAIREAAGHLTFLLRAVTDPERGSAVQGGIALTLVRYQIDQAHASGDPELISSFQVLDALLGTDLSDTRPTAELSTDQPRDGATLQPGSGDTNR